MTLLSLFLARFMTQKLKTKIFLAFSFLGDMYSGILRLCDNARWYAINHAPLVVFTICVLLYSIVLSMIAYHVKFTSDVVNPDVSKDWNRFLQSFADLELCIRQYNVSIGMIQSSTPIQRGSLGRLKQKLKKPIRMPNEGSRSGTIQEYRTSMMLEITPTSEFVKVPHNITILSTSLYGKYLGFKGDNKDQSLNITIVFPYQWQASICPSDYTACDIVTVNACVGFLGPKNMFPRSRSPLSCERTNRPGVEYRAGLNWQLPDPDAITYCRGRSVIKVHHRLDPDLTVRLSKEQRKQVSVRLLRSSYFMFVYVFIILGYAFIVNHSRRRRLVSFQSYQTDPSVFKI